MKHIIIVDDDLIETPQVMATLRMHGCSATHYTSPEDCVARIQDSVPPDLIFVDVMMPPGSRYSSKETSGGMFTGVFLAHDLRALFPQTPIAFLTSHHFDDHVQVLASVVPHIKRCGLLFKYELPDRIGHFAATLAQFDPKKESDFSVTEMFKSFWSSVVLRPSIAGVGIDLKTLLEKRKGPTRR